MACGLTKGYYKVMYYRFCSDCRMIKNPKQEAVQMTRFMKETITISIQNQKSSEQDLPITALLVNPRTSEILLTARDTRITTHHPLNHPIMLLLNQLPSLLLQKTTVTGLGKTPLSYLPHIE